MRPNLLPLALTLVLLPIVIACSKNADEYAKPHPLAMDAPAPAPAAAEPARQNEKSAQLSKSEPMMMPGMMGGGAAAAPTAPPPSGAGDESASKADSKESKSVMFYSDNGGSTRLSTGESGPAQPSAPAATPAPGTPAAPATGPNASGQPVATPPAPNPAVHRQIIYSASLALSVANKADTLDTIKALIDKEQGIISLATMDEINFRIIPARFDAVIAKLTTLGEVLQKEIRSEDVTDQFHDLRLRAEVAEGSRKRLMELLGSEREIKNVLEVERDIRRLTEEIEGMKGTMRVLQDKVDLTTIKVRIQEKQMVVNPRQIRSGVPFDWVNNIGLDRLLGLDSNAKLFSKEWSLARLFWGPRFQLGAPPDRLLPASFSPLRSTPNELIGISAKDYRLWVRRLELNKNQLNTLAFWGEAVEEEFKNFRGYAVESRADFKVNQKGLAATVLRAQTKLGSEDWAYDVWLVQPTANQKELYVIEYGRPLKEREANLKDVEAAIREMRVRSAK